MRTIVVLASLLTSTVFAETHPIASSAFQFSTSDAPARKKGLLSRIFHYVDGGDMHGFANPDDNRRKPENWLHTMTVRFKGHF